MKKETIGEVIVKERLPWFEIVRYQKNYYEALKHIAMTNPIDDWTKVTINTPCALMVLDDWVRQLCVDLCDSRKKNTDDLPNRINIMDRLIQLYDDYADYLIDLKSLSSMSIDDAVLLTALIRDIDTYTLCVRSKVKHPLAKTLFECKEFERVRYLFDCLYEKNPIPVRITNYTLVEEKEK